MRKGESVCRGRGNVRDPDIRVLGWSSLLRQRRRQLHRHWVSINHGDIGRSRSRSSACAGRFSTEKVDFCFPRGLLLHLHALMAR